MRPSALPSWPTNRLLLLTTLLGAILALLGPYTAHAFDPSNCYSWAEERTHTDLPPMWEMMSQAEQVFPQKGDLALFYYEKSGLPHIAVVEYVFHNGAVYISEANMYHLYSDGVGIRRLDPDYIHLVGYYQLHEPSEGHQTK